MEPDFVGSGYHPPEMFVPLLEKFSHPANVTQRTQLFNQLQRHHGNRYVQRVVAAYRSQNAEEEESKLASEILPKKGSGRALEPGNLTFQRLFKSGAIQAKLRIGQPNDIYEQEADRVADAVMRMPEPRVQRQPEEEEKKKEEEELIQIKPISEQITPLVQRQIDAEEEEEEEEILQTRKNPGQTLEVTPDLESRIHAIRGSGSGQPLPESVRTFFEPRFCYNFSQVRMYTDIRAAESARVLNARAYTVGGDIVFGAGQYAPGTTEGQRLLAHELIHVLQQSTHRAQGDQEFFVQRYPSSTPHGRPYTAGVMHNHRPSGRWADIQAIERSRCPASHISCLCSQLSPQDVLTTAVAAEMRGKPLANAHLLHYVSGGGADYAENVRDFITKDSGVRGKLELFARSIPLGHFKVDSYDYAVQDFRYAFGAIDRLDYEVDSAAGTVHVWFVDRYEFHPVYPGLYRAMPGDVARFTNCVHAAAVELKALAGAVDFWMVGHGAVPLSTVTGSAPSGGGTTL